MPFFHDFNAFTRCDSLAEAHAPRFVDVLLVVQDVVVPGQAEEVQHGLHGGAGVQHQLLVVHRHAPVQPQALALLVHGLHRIVPALQTLFVRCEVEPSDCHLGLNHENIFVSYRIYR